MISLEQKLDEFKKMGVYGVQVFFGENIGCDDIGVPLYERNLWVLGVPVGCLGGAVVLYKGTLQGFLCFDFKESTPKILSNPPKNIKEEKGNWFIWGTDDGVDTVLKRWYDKKSKERI